ncbi:MAG TPA: flagellar hook-associated protein FlgL [Burkholderiaceae bacterium]|nr:flagellar hook-associated protein FlgL [Burkholderiaceae bacterium]
MRISSTLFFQTGLNSINAQQSDLMHLYQQIGSGQRMVTPADDPLAAAQAINISQSQSLNKRFADNRAVANSNLGIEENTLNSVTTLLQDIKTRLIEAGNGTMADADRATLSNVLASARTSLLGLANATDGSGQYLFSGSRGNTAAFQEVGGKIVYMGDQNQRNIQADQTRRIAGSDVGSDIFNRAAPGTSVYLSTAGTGNAGTGLVTKPSITDLSGAGIGQTYTITFTSDTDYTVDVSDSSGAAVYSYTGTGYVAGTTKSIALQGGVQVEFSGQPAAGDTFKIEPASAPAYTATPGVALDPSVIVGTPRVSDSVLADPSNEFTVRFTSPTTYEVDMTDGDGNVTTNISNGAYNPLVSNTLELSNGMQLEVSGAPAAGDEIAVKATATGTNTNLNIFDTLDSIIAALENPMQGDDQARAAFQNTLSTAIQRIDVNYDNVLTVRASVGARMNELEALDANGAQRSLGYSSQLSKMEDLDYYTATTQLQLRSSALEAASLAFRKIQSLSLFNMGSN